MRTQRKREDAVGIILWILVLIWFWNCDVEFVPPKVGLIHYLEPVSE